MNPDQTGVLVGLDSALENKRNSKLDRRDCSLGLCKVVLRISEENQEIGIYIIVERKSPMLKLVRLASKSTGHYRCVSKRGRSLERPSMVLTRVDAQLRFSDNTSRRCRRNGHKEA